MAFMDVNSNGRVAIWRAIMIKLIYFGFLASVVSACGMKGDLYLPDESPPAERATFAESVEPVNKPGNAAGFSMLSSRN